MKKILYLLLLVCIYSCTKDRNFTTSANQVSGTSQDTSGSGGNSYFGALKINEFMAKETKAPSINDQGTPSDWVEFYNTTDSSIHIKANEWSVTDTLGQPDKFLIPVSFVIPSHGFVVVWCDKFIPSFTTQIHASFKISITAGSQLGIACKNKGKFKIVDAITYNTTQVQDISFGRFPDGGNMWQSFSIPTPGAPNN